MQFVGYTKFHSTNERDIGKVASHGSSSGQGLRAVRQSHQITAHAAQPKSAGARVMRTRNKTDEQDQEMSSGTRE